MVSICYQGFALLLYGFFFKGTKYIVKHKSGLFASVQDKFVDGFGHSAFIIG